MQTVSHAYKQSMELTTREGFYMDITIGVINQAAQDKAYVLTDENLYYANLTKPFNNYDVEYSYGTMEQNFFRVDGQMLLVPEEPPYFNAGLVSKATMGAVTIYFADGPYDIKGLTLDFGIAYPVDFTVESDTNTVVVTGNSDGHFVMDELFNSATYIKIIPQMMKGGQQRLRIEKISMGIGIYFNNQQIKSVNKKDFISLISEELPASDLSVTVKNKDRKFDVENSGSTINYLEIGQKCIVRYGKLLTNGSIEQLEGAALYLDSWKADDQTMSFGAKDIIADLNDTYYWGVKKSTSLYDLAVDVLTDAGVDERICQIDHYLKEVYVSNPMPAVAHKEALQIIANAGRCILYQNRQGIICIKAGFTTVIAPERMTVVSDLAEGYSDLPSVVLPTAKYDYARMYRDYFQVDGGMVFLPETGGYLSTGFVSRLCAGGDGLFSQNPKLAIALEAAFRFYGIAINFGGNPPTELIIHTYNANVLQEDYTVNVSGSSVQIEHAFPEFDTMEFEITKGCPDNAVIINYVKFGDVSDYQFTYQGMTKTPVGEQVERYKTIQVQETRYSDSSEVKELFKDTVSTSGVFTACLSAAGYGYTANYGTITRSSAYAVTVDLSNVAATTVELVITGREYIQATSDYVLQLNTTGGTQTWSNPLVSNSTHAALLAEWIGNYLNNNVEYDISYRGDFRLDAGDITFLENRYVDKLQVAICEHTLDFTGGALKGTVKARRAKNGVGTT